MDSVRVYPNGTSNSLPEEVQVTLIRSIRGLEHAQLTDYGYAVEYDFSDPTKLMHTLETKIVEGLFMAGQINGTTGYEEAAGQGFVAGVNAARKAAGLAQIVISRFDGYVGVMIDDLVTKGTDEPYRMFTSRAEHRLIMRQDNAMFRMLPFSKEIGIISKDRIATIEQWRREVANELERLSTTRANGCSLAQRLRRPEAKYEDIVGCSRVHPRVAEQVELELKYAGYIARETEQASKSRQMEGQSIPDWIDYDSILQLRFEAREKLSRIQPETLGQASRIPGVTPSDVSLLTAVIARGRTDGRGSA
jgi:tRNA uridine 5-carboxymethylaminomethyl modification enzyme